MGKEVTELSGAEELQTSTMECQPQLINARRALISLHIDVAHTSLYSPQLSLKCH